MKKYRLKKDLPTWKVGEEFWIGEDENLYGLSEDGKPVMVYHFFTLSKFDLLNNKEWFEEISEKQKSVWNLEVGDTYYYIEYNTVMTGEYEGTISNNRKNLIGEAFLSKEEAYIELEKRLAIQRIKKYCWENGIELVNNDFIKDPDNVKFYIYYNIDDDEFFTSSFNYSMEYNIFFFKTSGDASQVMENCGSDLKIIFNV